MPEYHHVHGPNEKCGPGCPAWYAALESGSDPWKDYTKPELPKAFNPEKWYPNAPLTTNEKAFLWYADDNSGDKGSVLDDTAHWKIIDRITKRNIYEFLKESEKIQLPMLWGYVVFLGEGKMYVKFLTHISPGKQDLEYMQNAIPDLESHFHRKVVDYDQEDTSTPILESYTPEGETSGFQGTEPPIGGPGLNAVPLAPQNPEPEPDYEAMAGEFKTLRKDVLQDGVTISTVFLGKMSPDPEMPFETLVFQTDDISGNSLEVQYNKTEQEAEQEHYRLVDKYNRLALDQSGAHNAHIQIMAYFNDAGILATEVHPDQLKLLPNDTWGVNAVEVDPGEGASHENLERPFMYHYPSNTLFYTTKDSHHMHIIPVLNQYLQDRGHSYDGPWVTGDITDPADEENPGRNWIKFIGSDTGHYPESVINYLQQKFGPKRDVIYNGYDGWEELPERYIQKG